MSKNPQPYHSRSEAVFLEWKGSGRWMSFKFPAGTDSVVMMLSGAVHVGFCTQRSHDMTRI